MRNGTGREQGEKRWTGKYKKRIGCEFGRLIRLFWVNLKRFSRAAVTGSEAYPDWQQAITGSVKGMGLRAEPISEHMFYL